MTTKSREKVDQNFAKRKADHIRLALLPENEATEYAGIDQIQLPHEALPDCNFEDVHLHCERFGAPVPTPFIVSSMTAGHKGGLTLNQIMAEAAEQNGWAMGVGSQRRQLFDAGASDEWLWIRQVAPRLALFGNLGVAQLITTPMIQIQKLIDSLTASAMIIHLNPLQECLQPEGTPQFKGGYGAIEQLVKTAMVPIIIKETGCGFSTNTLQRLNDCGVSAIDVSGYGGTHWGRIEGGRTNHTRQQNAAHTFKNWGVGTVQSILNAQAVKNRQFEIWGSGGVRSGLDAIKLLALGTHTVGFAKPILQAAIAGPETLNDLMHQIAFEAKIALFCTGSANIKHLQEKFDASKS